MMSTDELIARYKQTRRHKRLSKGNFKLAKHVGIFNLTAVDSCLNCKDCMTTCYARQAQTQYPTARHFRNENLHLAKHTPDVLLELLSDQIEKENIKVVRIHESGDFFSYDYVLLWFKVARRHPQVSFYGYTKMFNAHVKYADIAVALAGLNELPNVNIIDSFIDGKRNYGSAEYVKALSDRYNVFICPGKGCMSECMHCLQGDSVLFEIHGSLKGKDTYEDVE